MNARFSSFVFLCVLAVVSGETLQEAIIKDMMPPSSSQCTRTGGTFGSDFTFESSQAESKWFDGYPESYETYGAPWSDLEQYVFEAKMVHSDPDPDKEWTIRLGTGGNIYSYFGPMGETVAPQKRIDSPWIDEVWHSVGVEPPQPEEPFMIHGAGSYQSDQTYDENVGIPLTQIPFYSPSLGKYCSDSDRECGFIAWPQHGPVPVFWESTMINLNRYVDCGNGVVEHTVVHHNNMGSDKNLMRLDAPFGSVRYSVLRDMVVTDQTDGEVLIKPYELGNYAVDPTRINTADSLGYAIFAEDLPSKLSGPYPLAAGVSLTIHPVGCRKAPEYVSGYPAVMCRLEPTVPDSSGTRVAVTFRGTPPPVEVCDQSDPNFCTNTFKFLKYGSGTYCRDFGGDGAIMCRLDHNYLQGLNRSSGTSSQIKFTTSGGNQFSALGGIIYWSFNSPGTDVYSLILQAGADATPQDINLMIEQDPDAEWEIGLVGDAGGDVIAKNGVVNWVFYIQETEAYWLIFNPDEIPGVADIGSYVATKFPPGSTLEVLYDTGKPEEDNLALAHVHGIDFPNSQSWLADGYPRLILGQGNEGQLNRDANFYNLVTTATKMYQGGSHYYRQYFAMDRYTGISSTASSFVSEVIQDNYNINNANDQTPAGRTVKLYMQGNKVGATVGEAQCSGIEAPVSDIPSTFPSTYPSTNPSEIPTVVASGSPTITASSAPSAAASDSPTVTASSAPSVTASESPTVVVSDSPTVAASNSPTVTASSAPSVAASDSPTVTASSAPSVTASESPTVETSLAPSVTTSESPTVVASDSPTIEASSAPSVAASDSPTVEASLAPSVTTSESPTAVASDSPTVEASSAPSVAVSETPTVGASDTPSVSLSPSTATGPFIPYPLPVDRKGNTIILQSNGRVLRNKRMSRRLNRCVLGIRLKRHTGQVKGGPNEKLTFHFYTPDGVATGDKLDVDAIAHWYKNSRHLVVYPSAPNNDKNSCARVAEHVENMFPKNYYINVTYPEGYSVGDLEVRKLESKAADPVRKLESTTPDPVVRKLESTAPDPVCVGSTTPKPDSKALFEVKCGSATYIGSDPYYFAPDGFTEGDNKMRPYICKNDPTVRGTWRLLGFFPDGACAAIEQDFVYDEDICTADAIEV